MRSTALGLLAAALVRVAVDGARLAGEPGRFRNGEEAYNASAGWLIGHAGLWDQLLRLQYKAFCGGCTVHMATAALLLGDHVWVWRAVAVAWTLTGLLAGFAALDRLVGRAGAWAFAALYCVPALGTSELGLMLWGNHRESGVFVLLALALGGRPVWAALVLGLGVWFCRTTAYACVVLVPWLVWRRPWALLAFGVGLLPIALPAAAGDRGSYALGTLHTTLDPDFLWTRLRSLLVPERLGAYLVPRGAHATVLGGIELGAAMVGAVLLMRRPVLPLLALVFAGGWAVSGFAIPRILDGMGVLQLRYHAPWLLLLTLLSAGGAGVLWGRSRPAAGLLVGGVLLAHLAGQLPSLRAPRPAELDAPIVDVDGLVGIAAWRLDPARLHSVRPEDARVAAVVRRLEGASLAAAVREGRMTVDEAERFLDDPATRRAYEEPQRR